jgi:glycosyltransferase involved in cell wall biosynthesis
MSITVIIPTYNRASFLERAVLSVAEQTIRCAELIIVDDGSGDDTAETVKRLAGRVPFPLKYLYQENRGAAAARNTGIRNAASDYISFLDSDDWFAPEKLSYQLEAMHHSECLISHTREIWFRRGTLLQQKKKHQPEGGYIFNRCLQMCVVGMSTVMVRRSLFDRYGYFDESLPCCEDYDFWLRVSVREKFLLVPRQLTIKDGGRDDQLSVVYRLGMDRYRIRSIVNLLENDTLDESQYALALAELEKKCAIYGNGCLKHGREEEGEYYLHLPAQYSG